MTHLQPLIDAHHHFWALDKSVPYPWLEDQPVKGFFLGNYDAIRRPFLPDDLRTLVPEGYRLTGSVHCEAEARRDSAVAETEWIDALGKRDGLPRAHVGWAAFGDPACAEQLDAQQASPLFRGVRAKPLTATTPDRVQSVQGARGSLQDRRWCEGLSMLSERGLSWDLRVPAWHLKDAAETLAAYPELRVVLNHAGLPWDRTPQGIEQWRDGMQALAANPNVAVKLSELGTPFHPRDDAADLDILCTALEIFGPQRCLYASNAPVAGLRLGLDEWLSQVERAIAQSAPGHRQAVLHDNAVHWYRLAL